MRYAAVWASPKKMLKVALVPPVDRLPAPCLTPPRPCAISLLSTSHSSRTSYRADRRRSNVYVACRDHARLSKTFRAINYRPRLVPANFFQSMGRGRSGAREIIPLYRDPMPLSFFLKFIYCENKFLKFSFRL